jgi:hypothetical protein
VQAKSESKTLIIKIRPINSHIFHQTLIVYDKKNRYRSTTRTSKTQTFDTTAQQTDLQEHKTEEQCLLLRTPKKTKNIGNHELCRRRPKRAGKTSTSNQTERNWRPKIHETNPREERESRPAEGSTSEQIGPAVEKLLSGRTPPALEAGNRA